MDWLFTAWAIVTVVAFIDILIPDPLPFVDEVVLVLASIGLLIWMAVRNGLNALTNFWGAWGIAIMTFAATMLGLILLNKLRNPRRRKR